MDYNPYYDDDFDDPSDGWDDDPCEHCGPWCDDWEGDGLCGAVMRAQRRQSIEYEKLHIRLSTCPICGKPLNEYDIPSNDLELWTFCPERYDPIVILPILGPMWLKKGELHHKDNLYHVWIEWGDGIKESLLRYIKYDDLGSYKARNIELAESVMSEALLFK